MYSQTSVLSKQNRRLYDYLLTGRTIHSYHPAMQQLQVTFLNSRISDLVNRINVPVYKRKIEVQTPDGRFVTVTEYSLKPF